MPRRAFLILLPALMAVATTVSAATWRTLPIWGADVRSLAIHPDDPDTVFAGTSSGQLYLSRASAARRSPAGS